MNRVCCSDALTITFDAHSSTALKNGTELPNELGMSTAKRANVTHTNGGSSGIIALHMMKYLKHLIITSVIFMLEMLTRKMT